MPGLHAMQRDMLQRGEAATAAAVAAGVQAVALNTPNITLQPT